MAINPKDELTNFAVSSPSYPGGAAVDESVPGALDGSELIKAWLNDIFGFQQKLLAEAGIAASGNPDTVLASDYYDSLIALFTRTKKIDIGDWDMDATNFVQIPTGLPPGKIRTVSIAIRNDADTLTSFATPSLGSGTSALQLVHGSAGTDITITRFLGGVFDNTSYDSVGYNRGWVTIGYVD